MGGFKVLDRGDTAPVTRVLASAPITGSQCLTARGVVGLCVQEGRAPT
jgi:hypothetical protein